MLSEINLPGMKALCYLEMTELIIAIKRLARTLEAILYLTLHKDIGLRL